jgi:hypothetical protein
MVTSLILFKFDFTSQMMIYFCGNVIMYQTFYHFDHGLDGLNYNKVKL